MGEFATADDVKTRLGRDLTEIEKASAEATIATATGLIADTVNRDLAWADDLDPVPEALKAICVEKAIGVIVNPQGVASESETLGAHSHSQTYRRAADVGVFLTDFEERLVDQAVYGAANNSSSTRSMIDRVVEIAYGEELT